MKTTTRVLRGVLSLSIVVACLSASACVYHRHEVVVDDHGWRHEGFWDEHHVWHGGYYDERHVFHDDPGDWHH